MANPIAQYGSLTSTVNGGPGIASVGTHIVVTGQTSTTSFNVPVLLNSPAGVYELCGTVSVTSSSLSAGTVAMLWQTSSSWSAGTTAVHTILPAASITAVTDIGIQGSTFYSQAGATISAQFNFASIGTGSVTYNYAVVLKRLF